MATLALSAADTQGMTGTPAATLVGFRTPRALSAAADQGMTGAVTPTLVITTSNTALAATLIGSTGLSADLTGLTTAVAVAADLTGRSALSAVLGGLGVPLGADLTGHVTVSGSLSGLTGMAMAATLTGRGAVTAALTVTCVLRLTAEADVSVTAAFLQILGEGATTTAAAIGLGVTSQASIEATAESFLDYDPDRLDVRLMPGISVALPTPIIAGGRPVLPAVVARPAYTFTVRQGPTHIHAVPDPNPVWDPARDGWYVEPPASGAGDARWTVDSLPDPGSGWYWLGDPSGADGTAGIAADRQLWSPDGSTPGAPAWHSYFPYKPMVAPHIHYGPGGNLVTRTKGVRFNLQFIEHMWADFGTTHPSPFTWVVVAIVMDFPSAGYAHTLLDVGRSPAAGGVGPLGVNDLGVDRGLGENLQGGQRPALVVGSTEQHVTAGGPRRIVTAFDHTTRPKMFFAVFDGAASRAGSYSTSGKHIVHSALPATQTRYVVMGRQSGVLSRGHASHLVVFEVRWWHTALVEQQLDEQYGQLASSHAFRDYT